MKYIALLDCNNFFVSCERLFRPDLNNKPVVVLSSNDGCIVARSKEIKDKGIPMGVPYFQVKDILKNIDATEFSTNFTLYRDISSRVFNTVKSMVGEIEYYSIDECFFVLESDDPHLECLKIKRQVEKNVGIPVSIGLAPSKTIAKYQNTVAKRTNGISIWNKETWKEGISEIKLSELWGVGSARSRKFAANNLITIADFLALETNIVSKLFGIEGRRLYAELKGEAVLSVNTFSTVQKSITSTRSFAKETKDLKVVSDAIKYHLYQVVSDLEKMDLLTKNIQIMIAPSRHGDYFMHGSRLEMVLEEGTRDIFLLQKVCLELLNKAYKKGIPYKKAGVLVSQLTTNDSITKSLFPGDQSGEIENKKKVSNIIFEMNNKLGKDTILLGIIGNKIAGWQSKQDLLSPSYTTNWSNLKTVKAR